MKKPSLIIGRKQLILSVLTLILGTAVYLNYVLGGGNGLAAPQGQETSSGDSALVLCPCIL